MATLPVRRAKQAVHVGGDVPLPKIEFFQAQAEFSELFDRVLKDGPVEITCDGEDAVVVVSKQEWMQGRGTSPSPETPNERKRSAADFWLNSPLRGSSIELGPVEEEPQNPVQNMAEFLLNSPLRGSGLKLPTRKWKTRPVEF